MPALTDDAFARLRSCAMTEASVRIDVAALREFIAAAFRRLGMPEDDAETVAALMAEADLQGSDGHGVIRLPQYARRIRTRNRLPQFPEVPTMSESGLPGFEFNSWFALVAPARTPKPIIARLYEEVQKALADPDVRERLDAQGLTVRGTSPEELGTATRAQLAKYARVMKEANIRND